MFNSCSFMVNLCADPEVKTGQSGTNYVVFNGGVCGRKEGEDPIYIRCKSFGNTAKFLSECCHKGDRLIVSGSYEPWKSTEGTTVPEFVINNVEVVNHKQSQGQQPAQPQTPANNHSIGANTNASRNGSNGNRNSNNGGNGYFNYNGRRQQAGGGR